MTTLADSENKDEPDSLATSLDKQKEQERAAKRYQKRLRKRRELRLLAVLLLSVGLYLLGHMFAAEYFTRWRLVSSVIVVLLVLGGVFMDPALARWAILRIKGSAETGGSPASTVRQTDQAAAKQGWQRYKQQVRCVLAQLLFLGAFYFGTLVYAGETPAGPKGRWLWIPVLVLGLAYWIDQHLFQFLALKRIRELFSPAFEFADRRDGYGNVVKGMNRVLTDFNLASGFDEDKLDAIANEPPFKPEDDVKQCCEEFAARRPGLDVFVLELLYRGSQEEETKELKERWFQTEDKQKLASILVEKLLASSSDKTLSRFKETVPNEEVVSALAWILRRSSEFRLEQVHREMRCVVQLWAHQKDYTEHLSASSHGVFDRSFSLTELTGFLEDLPAKPGVAEDALLKACKQWFREWGDKRFPALERGSMALESMALVGLGVFAAEISDARFPLLSPSLLQDIARDENALKMLFGYRWKTSQRSGGSGVVLDLLADWMNLVEEAERNLGSLSWYARQTLRSQLTNGDWPTCLPVDSAAALKEKDSRRLDDLSKNPRSDPVWLGEVEELLSRVGGTIRNIADLQAVTAEVWSKVATAKTDDEKAKVSATLVLQPETPPIGRQTEYQPILDGVGELKGQLADVEGMLPKVEELYNQNCKGHTERQAILDAVDAVKLELRELEGALWADGGGGSKYLITFDQTRGPLADLIDSLANKYHFDHYTRYARIGKFQRREGFEHLYRKLTDDLETLFEAATDRHPVAALATAGKRIGADPHKLERVAVSLKDSSKAPHWEKVEVKIQRLFHSYDFIIEVADDWEERPDLMKVFMWPPSHEKTAAPKKRASPAPEQELHADTG